ncbi:MAG: 50S ribosomal protein L19 [Acidobacteriota bacterium]|nr:MAG: 50S ribosomal protein L19 [Acidobacteriota bacterium]
MDDIIQGVESGFRKETVAPFVPGDTVQVHLRIKEGERQRTQVFEGVVVARRGSGLSETLTVRKRSFGVGVEKVFPVHAPTVEEIRVVRRGRVRRAKLYYLREKIGKAARIAGLAGLEEPTAADPAGEAAVEAAPEAASEAAPDEAAQEKTSEDSAPAAPQAAEDAPTEEIPPPSKPT